jgi:hypothetical protein
MVSLSQLAAPMTLVLRHQLRWQESIDKHCEGYCTDRGHDHFSDRQFSDRFKIQTEIVIFERRDVADKARRLRIYMQILLHEMLHAFSTNFVCFCIDCRVGFADIHGITGHGLPWYRVMLGLKNSFERI